MVALKSIQNTHKFIASEVDPILREMELELVEDREIEKAFREAQRAENLITFRKEIKSRPKTEWIMSKKDKEKVKKSSKKELKTLKE